MSIHELVVCDYCDFTSVGPTVPETWVSTDGEHFCTKWCAVTHWNRNDKSQHIGELI